MWIDKVIFVVVGLAVVCWLRSLSAPHFKDLDEEMRERNASVDD